MAKPAGHLQVQKRQTSRQTRENVEQVSRLRGVFLDLITTILHRWYLTVRRTIGLTD